MVRLKHRYVLFDIVYPPEKTMNSSRDRHKFSSFSLSPKEALLQLHEASSSRLNQRSITTILRQVIEDHFGELGAGLAGQSLVLKYYSSKTSTGILRCNRQHVDMVMASIALVTKLDDRNVTMRCIHVSGTIRKCEEYLIRRNRELMIALGVEGKSSNLDDLIQSFGQDDKSDDED